MVEGGFALLQTLRGHNGATRWRDGRVVEGNSLENCRRRQSTVGSNPTLSAKFFSKPLISLDMLQAERKTAYNPTYKTVRLGVPPLQVALMGARGIPLQLPGIDAVRRRAHGARWVSSHYRTGLSPSGPDIEIYRAETGVRKAPNGAPIMRKSQPRDSAHST